MRIFTSSENVTTVKYFIFQKISVTIVEQFWEFSEFSKCSEMFVWLKCDYSQCVTLVTVSTTVTKFEGRIFFVFLFYKLKKCLSLYLFIIRSVTIVTN